MAMLTIGTTAFPNPAVGQWKVNLSDLDGDAAGRSGTGVLVRDRIRAAVYQIEAGFILTGAQLEVYVPLLAPASFSVTFYDGKSAAYPTKTMYCGDRTMELVTNISDAAPDATTWKLSFSLIEF